MNRWASILLLALAGPVAAQDPAETLQERFELAPLEVRYVLRAADSILSTGTGEGVSLEAFNAGITTGVYLYGTFGGELESVGYGRDPDARRYLWLAVDRGDSLEYMAMLYDIDQDLTPDFLLLRTIDWTKRAETSSEYRAPSTRELPLDITLQSACLPPRCDPTTWTAHERVTLRVPAFWFEGWRSIFGLAAMRGERWLGRPVVALPTGPP